MRGDTSAFVNRPKELADLIMQKAGLSIGVTIALLSGLIFGLYPSAARVVYAEGGNAVFMMIFTTWARTAALLLWCAWRRQKIFQSRADVKEAVVGGVFQAGSIICIFASLLYVSGPVMITVFYSYVIMLLLFSASTGETRLSRETVFVTLAALLGISLVVNVWQAETVAWKGVGLAFVAALMSGSRMYIYGRLTKYKNPGAVGAEAFIVASLIILVLAMASWPVMPVNEKGWIFAALGALSAAMATVLMFYGIALLGAFRNSLYTKIEPLSTALFGVWILGEYLQPVQYLGIVLVIGSLVAFQWRERRSQHDLTTPALSDKTART